jgi:hypothetical protein
MALCQNLTLIIFSFPGYINNTHMLIVNDIENTIQTRCSGTPVIPDWEGWGKGDHELDTSLGYITSLCQRKKERKGGLEEGREGGRVGWKERKGRKERKERKNKSIKYHQEHTVILQFMMGLYSNKPPYIESIKSKRYVIY